MPPAYQKAYDSFLKMKKHREQLARDFAPH